MRKTKLIHNGAPNDLIDNPQRCITRLPRYGLTLVIAIMCAFPVQAQDSAELSLPPADVITSDSSLTSYLNRGGLLPVGTRISRGNIGDWKERLVPEFTELIRSGKMIAIAQTEHVVDWPSSAWIRESGPNSHAPTRSESRTNDSSPEPSLSQRDTAIKNTVSSPPYPSGSYESIDGSSSPAEKVEKTLANINSIFSSHAFQRTRADILNFENGKLFRGYKFVVERLYPKLIDPSNSSAQIFREKLTVLDPAPINGLSWLTFRFRGADEDLLFHYSPLAKKSVQLSSTNRLNRIAGTSLSLDDLTTWSGKPETLTIGSIDKDRKLFPISFEKTLKLSEQSGTCATILKDSSSILLNTTRTQNDIADWSPLNIPFIERDVITLNLITTDFHNPIGKVVLQVDMKTFLPLTKSSYDRSGNLVKFVFSVFNLVESSTKFNFTPLASFIFDKSALTTTNPSDDRGTRLMGRTPKTSNTSVILYRSDERCSTLPADMSLNDFDLKGMGIKVSSPQETKAEQSQKNTGTPPVITPSIEPGKESSNKKEIAPKPSVVVKQAETVASKVTPNGAGQGDPGISQQKNSLAKQTAEEPQALTQESAPDND